MEFTNTPQRPSLEKAQTAEFSGYAGNHLALRATACPQSWKGRAIAKRRRSSAAFWREGFETVCFDSFILKQALKQTRSVCLRAF
jgi:hypothetical protein